LKHDCIFVETNHLRNVRVCCL